MVFPPDDRLGLEAKWRVLVRVWVPGRDANDPKIREQARAANIPLEEWEREGFVSFSGGDLINYRTIRAQVLEDRERFDIQEIGFDRYNCMILAGDLEDEGIPMVECRQGFLTFNGPTKELAAKITSKQIEHAGQPALRWAISNLEVRQDTAGNYKPVKPDSSTSPKRIDPAVAAIMALGRAMANEVEAPEQNPYETRGFRSL